jgi:2-polyprenyl-3-methyl-5-hydroxy-6-metoxy-1,4-benzoquinol methylase
MKSATVAERRRLTVLRAAWLFDSRSATLRADPVIILDGLKMFPPREGMQVLDVGCGTGLQLAGYRQAGCRVTGIDASPAMLQVAGRARGHHPPRR